MRQRIITTVIEAISKNGLKFKIEDLARELRVSKRTIYEYFNSKEELIHSAIEYVFSLIEVRQEEILQTADVDVMTKLRQMILLIADFEVINEKNLNQLKQFYPKQFQRVNDWKKNANPIYKMVSMGKLDPSIYPVNLTVCEQMVSLFINYLFESDFLKATGLTLRQALSQMAEILILGIKEDEGYECLGGVASEKD